MRGLSAPGMNQPNKYGEKYFEKLCIMTNMVKNILRIYALSFITSLLCHIIFKGNFRNDLIDFDQRDVIIS